MPRLLTTDQVPVTRRTYDNGTVSYDLDHQGQPVRVSVNASRTVRLHFRRLRLRLDRLANSPTDGWTNVDLVPIDS